MVSILNSRNLIYWWVFLTSFIFLQQPTHDVAQRFFRDNARFKQDSFPFSLAGGLTAWIDDRAKQIVSTFSFDPNAIVIQIQGVKILDGFRVGLILILLLLILAFRFYSRAVDSPAIYDDILALLICFFVYHLVAQTFKVIKFLPNAKGVSLGDQMIAERSTWVWVLAVVVLLMVLGGKGWTDAKVFWKGLIELFSVWLFLIPEDAAKAFAALLDTLANFGSVLSNRDNVSWAIVWASIGLLLALRRLYTAQPAGGGGGGKPAAKPAGGGAGGGGLLKRLGGK